MRKLAQIWQNVPNRRIGPARQARICTSVSGESISSAMGAVLGRYAEYQDNGYFMSLVVSRDIYKAVMGKTTENISPAINLKCALDTNEGTTCSGNSTATSSGRYRLAENVTFAEITNRLNCGLNGN